MGVVDISAVIAAIAAVAGIFVTIMSAARTAGKQAEFSRETRRIADSHTVELDRHQVRITSSEMEIAKLNEWKSGYNAAARLSGKETVL